jgi:iron(III) transport system substrate-binding protein
VLDWAEEGFEAAHPDVDLRWMQVASDETLRILREKKQEERPDVWWGAPSWLLAAAAQEDLLVAASPSWIQDVPAYARDAEGRWVGVALDPLVLAFDRDQVSLGRAPRDWIDVFHPRWQGEVVAPDAPATIAGSLLVGSMVGRDLATGGDGLGGLDWLRRLDATVEEYAGSEGDVAARLVRGQATIGILRLSAARAVQHSDSSIVYRLAEAGTPVLVEGVAVPAGVTDLAVAGSFVEWLGSSGPSLDAALRFSRMPVRRDVGGAVAPDWLVEASAALQPWVAPSEFLGAHLDAWIERWGDEVRRRSPWPR